jgi:hypothetical protein
MPTLPQQNVHLVDTNLAVHVVGGSNWPAAIQSAIAVIAIIVSVFAGIRLQDRARIRDHAHQNRLQTAALVEIAGSCVETLAQLNRMASAHKIEQSQLKWLEDVSDADVGVVDRIDLLTLKAQSVIKPVTTLQTAVRSGRRRLMWARKAISEGGSPSEDAFADALKSAMDARNLLLAEAEAASATTPRS